MITKHRNLRMLKKNLGLPLKRPCSKKIAQVKILTRHDLKLGMSQMTFFTTKSSQLWQNPKSLYQCLTLTSNVKWKD